MKIDALPATSIASASKNQNSDAQAGFRALFEAALSNGQSMTNANEESAFSLSTSSKVGKPETAQEAAVRELHDYLSKTPAQRMRESILKEMHLTESDIKNMPPDQQNAVEAAIREKVKERLLAQDKVQTLSAQGLSAVG